MPTLLKRVYRLLLYLYPAEYRRAYGVLMAQAFDDLCADTLRRNGTLGLFGLWLHVLADLLTTVVVEHRDAARKRENAGIVPRYSSLQLSVLMALILGIVVYHYVAPDGGGITAIYGLLLVSGMIVYGLQRLGLVPVNPIWNAYTTGILLGIGSIVMMFAANLTAFGVYRVGFAPLFIPLVSLAVYAGGVVLASRFGGAIGLFRHIAALLALTTVVSLLIDSRASADAAARFLSLHYALMQTLTVLVIAAVSSFLARQQGDLAFIVLLVALGVHLIWIDPGYFTGAAGQWINMVALLFPLVIGPLWWLIARTHPSRVWGMLALWALFVFFIAVAPGIARVALEATYPGAIESPAGWSRRALAVVPYFAALWFALQVSGVRKQAASALV